MRFLPDTGWVRLWCLFLGIFLGAGSTLCAVDLVSSGANWRYFKGVSEASSPDPAAWRTLDFSDTAWLSGPATFWYGDLFNGTQIPDMQNNYLTLFFRREFNVLNPADIEALVLNARCDDGFIAWINGVEVARYNVPEGDLPFTGTASGAANPDPAEFQQYTLSNPKVVLKPGRNLLAVQVFNVNYTSSDIVWDASLVATIDQSAPALVNLYPPQGATLRELTSIEVEFSETVTGVDAGDLRVGGVPATGVSRVSGSQYLFTFPKVAAGNVSISIPSNAGIADLAATPHAFAGFTWNYTIDPTLKLSGVVISEFLSDNDKGLRDEDGDRGDWIEIRNDTRDLVSLGGWFLTDDPAVLDKWRIPSVVLSASKELLIFASGKNRTNPAGKLHTNFKLGSGGGYLALVSPSGEVVSDFGPAYPAQRKDVSYGRPVGGGSLTGFFVTPTPGAPNSTSGAGFAPEVIFSVSSRPFYTEQVVSLSLSEALPGAVIRYTTDGTQPTGGSPAYTGPLTLSVTTMVRARAYAPGLLPGELRGETYLKMASSLASVNSDLPIIVLHNFGRGRPPATGMQVAHMQLFEPLNGVTRLTNEPALSSRVGLGARGSSTLGIEKVSMSLEFRNELDVDRNRSILGMPADSDWVLYAPNNFEPVLIHNPFMHQLSRDIGRYSPRTRFVEVYLVMTGGANETVNSGAYAGIYVLEEKIKRGPDRVDVNALSPGDSKPPQVTGGYMMKIDRAGPGEGGFIAAGSGIIYVDPKEREITLPAYAAHRQYLQSYMDAFGNALYGNQWLNPTTGYAAYINTDSWIDHHLLNVVALNVDSLRLSTYFYKPRNGRLEYGPLWDFDRALGSTDGRDFNARAWNGAGNGSGTDFFNETSQAWWGRLFRDLEFYQRYIDRYQALRFSHFSTTNLWRLIDDLTGQVRRAQPREQTRWGVGQRTATGGGGGTYATETQWMKRWISNRTDFIDRQFVRPAAIATSGGRFTGAVDVVITRPAAGVTYYTLDGSDPRLPGGGVSLKAQVASDTPIRVTSNARVVARVYNSAHTALTGTDNPPLVSKWSGSVATSYYNQLPPLRITEIQYHPYLEPGSTNVSSDFEFIEVRNIGPDVLRLPGFRIEGAVAFEFTTAGPFQTLGPGERAVVVANASAFRKRYPAVQRIAGEYVGNLANGDERLRLIGPLGEPILDFRYSESWHPLSDGFGFSLVLKDDAISPESFEDGSKWRLSAAIGGSPEDLDPPPTSIQPVVVNEVLAHTDPPLLDSIEVWNAGTGPQSITGWWLSDDFRAPKKYRISAGAPVEAGGFVVFDESQFRPGDAGNEGFSLSALGDEVHLFSADASGELTGWHSGFSFGASFNGISLGRYVTSDGRALLVPQFTRTLGAANAGPRVPRMAITEIHFEPVPVGGTNNNLDEFVEVRNTTGADLPLYDVNYPENRWRLRGAVSCDFPVGTSLPPGGFAVVVGFDPVTDTSAAAAFRQKFGMPAGVPLFGPWQGALNNAGEEVRVQAPDEPVPPPASNAGEVAFVTEDAIDYLPGAPWPVGAAGSGSSLQRLRSRSFGNDPVAWRTGVPTPGRVNDPSDVLDADSDRDGLPDAWEIANGLDPLSALDGNGANGDPDSDGFTNAQEFAAGTRPRDAGSLLRLDAVRTDGVELRISVKAGRSYTLEGRNLVDGSEWQVLQRYPVQGADGSLGYPVDPSAPMRFFRISTP